MSEPKKNDILTARCEALGSETEGVCRSEGRVYFVPGALPGEEILFRLVQVRKNYGYGRLEKILMPSPDRIEPACPVFPRCGGCTARHLAYAAQLEAKRAKVRDCLARIGGLSDPPVGPVLGMEDPRRYRNKGAFPVGGTPGAVRIGCFAARSHQVIDAPDGCLLQSLTSDRLIREVRGWANAHRLEPYDETSHTGLLRHVMTREAADGSSMLVLVVNGQSLPHAEELIARLRGAVPGLASVCLSSNTRRTNVILGETVRVLWGSGTLTDTLLGFSYRVSPRSFFQVNHSQTEVLYRQVLDACGLRGDETVFDLYCGCGTITLPLASRARRAVGVEIVEDAVRDARENARANGVGNAVFYAGAAEALFPSLLREWGRPDVLVMDPPRKGCEPEVLRAAAEAAPGRIVYVSCDPATLARDVRVLCGAGYRPEKAVPVDMFPWTGHVETVCLLYHQKKDFISVPYEPKNSEYLKQNN